jgi:hypothetical protein
MVETENRKGGEKQSGFRFVVSIPLMGAGLAVSFAVSLFIIDIFGIGGFELHAFTEGFALIFIGISFMTLCFTYCRGMDRYHWRMMMGITFVLWGIEAMLPLGLLRLIVRDAVVLMFILDLVLMILDWRPAIFGRKSDNAS